MGSLVARVILAGIAASISPIPIMVLLSMMMRPKVLRNVLSFLLGYTIILIALGLVVALVMRASGSGQKEAVDAYINIVFGALCFLSIPLAIRPETKKEESDSREKGLKASTAFLSGMSSMLVNLSTIICFASGIHEISQVRPGPAEVAISGAVLLFVTLSTLIIPITIDTAFPKVSGRALGKMNAFLSKHRKSIGVAVLVIFGVYLLAKGIVALV
jgi:threonine/homoserine/homoserine lactone efflux protein